MTEGKKMVLLVEDDPATRRACYERPLRRASIPFVSAMSYEEAIATFTEHKEEVGIVVLDGTLRGGRTGIDVLVWLMSQGFDGTIIAASDTREVVATMKKLGAITADDPMSKQSVCQKVIEVLSGGGQPSQRISIAPRSSMIKGLRPRKKTAS